MSSSSPLESALPQVSGQVREASMRELTQGRRQGHGTASTSLLRSSVTTAPAHHLFGFASLLNPRTDSAGAAGSFVHDFSQVPLHPRQAIQTKPTVTEPGSELAQRSGAIGETAERGLRGSAGELPHLEKIQRAFGRHDVSGVRAHVGGPASGAARAIGAAAYTVGNRVAFEQRTRSRHCGPRGRARCPAESGCESLQWHRPERRPLRAPCGRRSRARPARTFCRISARPPSRRQRSNSGHPEVRLHQ